MRCRIWLSFLPVIAVACDHAAAPPVATSLAASSSVNVAGIAGAPVSPAPSVIVKDQHDSPMAGVPVTFAVTSGGGTVTGGAVTTGADGIATVGSWTLGTATGLNVLTATSGTLTPVTFNGTATAGPPNAVAKVSGDNQTGIVATPVTTLPSVQVNDAFGNPVTGVNVVFTVGIGGGSITGGTRTTGADGIATVGSWILGTSATVNTLDVTVGSLAPVTFVATAAAGPASRLVALLGDMQTGRAGAHPPTLIVGRVTDQYGNAKGGVAVNFSVTSGGGSIDGLATAVSEGDGAFFFGNWILGPNPGTNTLTASIAGGGSVIFTVTAVANECNLNATHTIGTTNSGTLTLNDCVLSTGELIDYYRVDIATPSSIEIRQASSEFDSYVYFTASDGTALAEDDDEASSANPRMKVLAPAGSYRIGASSFSPSETGSYSISSSIVSESEEQCETVFIVPGIVSATQSISNTDCVNTNNNTLHADLYAMKLRAGTAIRFKMTSSAVDPYLELYRFSTGLVASNDNINSSTTDAEIVYTPVADEYFFIVARTAVGSQTGAYSLRVENASSAATTNAPNPVGTATRLHTRKAKLSVPWIRQ